MRPLLLSKKLCMCGVRIYFKCLHSHNFYIEMWTIYLTHRIFMKISRGRPLFVILSLQISETSVKRVHILIRLVGSSSASSFMPWAFTCSPEAEPWFFKYVLTRLRGIYVCVPPTWASTLNADAPRENLSSQLHNLLLVFYLGTLSSLLIWHRSFLLYMLWNLNCVMYVVFYLTCSSYARPLLCWFLAHVPLILFLLFSLCSICVCIF